MLLEKCKVLGTKPSRTVNLQEVEDMFLTIAISKKYERK
jgi:hypothetical protein